MPQFAVRKGARRSEEQVKRLPRTDNEDQRSDGDHVNSGNDESEVEGAASSDVESISTGDASEDPDSAEAAQQRLSKVSFGALAKAQTALSGSWDRKRKRGQDTNSEHESKLDAIRGRLKELREQKERRRETNAAGDGEVLKKGKARSGDDPSSKQDDFFNDGDTGSDSGADFSSDSDASSHDGATKKHKRSSKHAPTALPANRAVPRHRDVVQVSKIKSRDPRFDPTSGHLDRNTIDTRYSFLNDYQATELTSLRKALKDPRAKLTDDQREKLQRKAISMESKIAANKAREREEKIRREHKQKERDAVAQGKKPFYLKKGEVRKQALVDRFESLKSRQKDKVIQRRRKKLASKEWRDMPTTRRG
jgi:ribosomal RNA-processing protein 36